MPVVIPGGTVGGLGNVGSLFTFGDTIRRILGGVNEPVTDKNKNSVADYLNDAIESIWMSMLLATLSRFSKGPVNQVFAANETTQKLVTVPDPTSAPNLTNTGGGTGGIRTVYVSYCLVTDSGSTTKISPLASITLAANNLFQVASPILSSAWANDIIGYYVFAGLNADGSDQGQQSPLIKIGTIFVEPGSQTVPAPNSPYPPSENTTADNIFNIVRLDVQNQDMTWTNWVQSNLNSTWFSDYMKRVQVATTWQPLVYDFIEDRQIEVRPAPGMDLTGTYFYTTRPRRLRFEVSRMPFAQFAVSSFLMAYVKGMFLLDLYEYEASDRWKDQAEKERMRIILQVGQTNFNQNNTIRPFSR